MLRNNYPPAISSWSDNYTFIQYQVAPRELEDIIQDLPGVDSVVVVGVPDEEYQELAKAFVIKQPGSSLTEDDVIKVVQGNPIEVWFVVHLKMYNAFCCIPHIFYEMQFFFSTACIYTRYTNARLSDSYCWCYYLPVLTSIYFILCRITGEKKMATRWSGICGDFAEDSKRKGVTTSC